MGGYIVKDFNRTYFERARSVIREITFSDRTVLLFHPDGDGVSAARNMLSVFGRMTPIGSLDDKCWLTDRLYEKAIGHKPSYLVSVDLPLDKKGENLEHLKELKAKYGTTIIVFDHHPVETDLNELGMIHVNSHILGLPLEEPSNYCASALVRDFGVYCGASVVDWVAGLGLCGDNCDGYFTKFMKEFSGDIKVLKGAGRKMGLVGRASDDGPSICLTAVLRAREPNDLLRKNDAYTGRFAQRADDLKERVDKHIANFGRRKRKVRGDAYVFRFSEEYGITSAIIGALKGGYPRTFLALLNENDGKASFRTNNSEISARELALFLKEKLGLASAGGHDMASGALVPKDKYNAFEEACVDFLGKA